MLRLFAALEAFTTFQCTWNKRKCDDNPVDFDNELINVFNNHSRDFFQIVKTEKTRNQFCFRVRTKYLPVMCFYRFWFACSKQTKVLDTFKICIAININKTAVQLAKEERLKFQGE